MSRDEEDRGLEQVDQRRGGQRTRTSEAEVRRTEDEDKWSRGEVGRGLGEMETRGADRGPVKWRREEEERGLGQVEKR